MYVVWGLCVVLCQGVMCGVVFGVCVWEGFVHTCMCFSVCVLCLCVVYVVCCTCICVGCVWYMGGQVCAWALGHTGVKLCPLESCADGGRVQSSH